MLTATIALPFLAAFVLRLRRAEGRLGHVVDDPAVRRHDLRSGAAVLPCCFSAAAAFGPEQRPPEITQALNDVFWLWFIGIVGTIVIQNITLAIASFTDKADPPTFPRWYGYPQPLGGDAFLPGCVVVVFNDGPLAWNGVFAFYIPGSRSGGLVVRHHLRAC